MQNVFKLDLRSLAAVRFFLGTLAFFDIFNRISHVLPFYSDSGILPRWLLVQQFQISWRSGLLQLVGDPVFAYILIIVGLIASVLMAIGLRTRLATLIVWLVTISFHARFPEANHGGDNLFRLMLFMSFFLPMNRYFSFDSVLQENSEADEKSHLSLFTAAWVIQIAFIYGFTFYYKWTPTWFEDFDSLYYAMSLDMFTTQVGDWLLNYPLLMKVLSFSTFWIEGAGPFLVLIPFGVFYLRSLAVVLFFGLHIGIWLTMQLGNFPPACLILWLAMIPGEWWNYLNEKLKTKNAVTLYYDPDCGFCRKFSWFLKSILLVDNLSIKAGNENPEVLNKIIDNKSWVLIKAEKAYIRFEAFEVLLSNSKIIFLRLLPLINFSKFGGNYLYKIISQRRHFWGVLLNQISFSTHKMKLNVFEKILAILFIIIGFAWNVEGTKAITGFKINSPIDEIVFTFQWNQQWNMFAPRPLRNDGWFITKATLENGATWDILNDQEYTEVRPVDLSTMFKSSQWRKFLNNLFADQNQTYLLWFGRYLCRDWNELNPRYAKVKSYELIFMRELSPEPGEIPRAVDRFVIWNHKCF